jgi:hypothetical protein
LEKIPERLETEKAHIEDLHKQLEAAKEELGRSFPQARELEEKSARLTELDILLNMDNQEQPQQENEATPAEEEISVTKENGVEDENAPVLDGGAPEAVTAGEPLPGREAEKQKFQPEISQRVVFHPDGGTVKLTGKVVSIEEETVTVQAGSRIIPVYKNKGRFEPEREPVTVVPTRSITVSQNQGQPEQRETSGVER